MTQDEKSATNIHKIEVHDCLIHATEDQFAAIVIAQDEQTGEPFLARSFFTDRKAIKGDAIEQAVQYAKLNSPEAMVEDSEDGGLPLRGDLQEDHADEPEVDDE